MINAADLELYALRKENAELRKERMDGLKWQSTKNWNAPKDGYYLLWDFVDVMPAPVWIEKGCCPHPKHNARFVLGPIRMPEPELELPEGWIKCSDEEVSYSNGKWAHHRIKAVRKPASLVNVEADTRTECVTAVNAAIKALEGK